LNRFCTTPKSSTLRVVGAVQIHDGVRRHLGILVGLVAGRKLAADRIDVDADLPGVGDGVFDSGLEAMLRNVRKVIA